MANLKNLSNKKKVAIIAVTVLLFIALASMIANASNDNGVEDMDVNPDNGDIIEVSEETTEEESEVVEAPVAEREVSAPVVSNNRNNGNQSSYQEVTIVDDREDTSAKVQRAEEVTIVLNVEKLNPTVNTYSNNAFGKVSVIRNGKDITNSCSISYDSSKVGSVSGVYTVNIFANCGSNGTAARSASITLYVPAKEEAPKAESKTDTSSATPAPKTEVVEQKQTTTDAVTGEVKEEVIETRRTDGAQEMTKIIIVNADGSQTTYVKTEVENVYADQIVKIFNYNEVPGNYKINGNTLTVAGRTFIAQ